MMRPTDSPAPVTSAQPAKRADFPKPIARLAMGPVYAKRAIRDFAAFGRRQAYHLS